VKYRFFSFLKHYPGVWRPIGFDETRTSIKVADTEASPSLYRTPLTPSSLCFQLFFSPSAGNDADDREDYGEAFSAELPTE
jgi:hypothetical protein